MKRYAVEVTDTTAAAIVHHARYIAIERQEPLNAQAWLEAAWDKVDSLETMPKRCAIAPEDEDVPYEVRAIPMTPGGRRWLAPTGAVLRRGRRHDRRGERCGGVGSR